MSDSEQPSAPVPTPDTPEPGATQQPAVDDLAVDDLAAVDLTAVDLVADEADPKTRVAEETAGADTSPRQAPDTAQAEHLQLPPDDSAASPSAEVEQASPASGADAGPVLELVAARVAQGTEDLLPATSLRVAPGEVVLVLGPPGPTLTALALTAAGRLQPTDGTVTYGGSADPTALRRGVALVDVPHVSEPEAGVPVRTVVSEELAFAGLPSSRRRAAEWLAAHDRAHWGSLLVRDVPALERVNGLADLAALRPGVTHLVLGFPERHGGPPVDWLAVARRHAADGLGVVLTVSRATATEQDVSSIIGAAAPVGAPPLVDRDPDRAEPTEAPEPSHRNPAEIAREEDEA